MTQTLHGTLALTGNNLRSNRGRATYLVLTLATTVAAWLLLAALAAPFVGSGGGKGSGIMIRNGNGQGALPLAYARRIEAIPGATDVSWLGLQMVKCGGSGQITVNALGGPGAGAQLTEQKADAIAIKRWQADPLGAVLTQGTASTCGWRAGQGIEPASLFSTQKIPMHVIAIVPGSQSIAFMHFDYINRIGSMQGKDKVYLYQAKARNARDNDRLAARIQTAFAHDFPTITATTNATEANAWARFGKVQQLVGFVMAAILLCAGSVLVSMLAHTAAQRRARFAILEVLGFQRGTLFAALALELIATVIVAALIGAGLGKGAGVLMAHTFGHSFFGLISDGFAIPAWAFWWTPAWLAVLVIAALAWPAALVARVRPADYRAI